MPLPVRLLFFVGCCGLAFLVYQTNSKSFSAQESRWPKRRRIIKTERQVANVICVVLVAIGIALLFMDS